MTDFVTPLYRPTRAEINLDHVRANFDLLHSLAPPGAFFCPMVKADAYGHGAAGITRAVRAAGAAHVGVVLIEEALGLRAAGDRGNILVFGPFADRASAEALLTPANGSLTPVLSEHSQLAALASASGRPSAGRTKIHFKFNTGMNRLGFSVDEAPRLREWLDRHPAYELEGVCTHLLRGDDADRADGDTRGQLANFGRALTAFRGLNFFAHALNSSGLVARAGGNLGARPGISLYGAQASKRPELHVDLKPVMKLKSEIIALNGIAAGAKVSYNGTWSAKRESLIGVVPVGYADGYRRALSNNGSVLCRGRRVPVVGTVCMDYFMIDVTDVAPPADAGSRGRPFGVGEEVVLIGEQGGAVILAEELAERAGTISYEIFTGIGARVPRIFLNGPNEVEAKA